MFIHFLLLLSTHSLIDWMPQGSVIFWHLILFCFAKYVPYTFISFASNICLVLDMSALVFRAKVIVERRVGCLIYIWFCFLSHIFVSPPRSFNQPATPAAFWARILIYFARFLELVMFKCGDLKEKCNRKSSSLTKIFRNSFSPLVERSSVKIDNYLTNQITIW